jgi:uncharacterized protein
MPRKRRRILPVERDYCVEIAALSFSRCFNNLTRTMNRDQKIPRAKLLNRGLNAAAVALFATFAVAPLAHAASFTCPHNASASERIVCNDPALSALDDKLAALYRNAFDATTDTTALEADRVSQWQWRQHNCKDKACVTDWYNRRIAEMEGDVKHGKQATVQRVKESVVDQDLAPSAQHAVLEIKGIEPANPGQHAAPASSADGAKGVTKTNTKLASADTEAALHLQKMPSGVAADARQQRLAEAHAHHIPPANAASPAPADASPIAAKMASAGTAFSKAAGMAALDAPTTKPAQPVKGAESNVMEKSQDQAAQQPSKAGEQANAGTVTCSSVASAEPARQTESTIQQGAVALK